MRGFTVGNTGGQVEVGVGHQDHRGRRRRPSSRTSCTTSSTVSPAWAQQRAASPTTSSSGAGLGGGATRPPHLSAAPPTRERRSWSGHRPALHRRGCVRRRSGRTGRRHLPLEHAGRDGRRQHHRGCPRRRLPQLRRGGPHRQQRRRFVALRRPLDVRRARHRLRQPRPTTTSPASSSCTPTDVLAGRNLIEDQRSAGDRRRRRAQGRRGRAHRRERHRPQSRRPEGRGHASSGGQGSRGPAQPLRLQRHRRRRSSLGRPGLRGQHLRGQPDRRARRRSGRGPPQRLDLRGHRQPLVRLRRLRPRRRRCRRRAAHRQRLAAADPRPTCRRSSSTAAVPPCTRSTRPRSCGRPTARWSWRTPRRASTTTRRSARDLEPAASEAASVGGEVARLVRARRDPRWPLWCCSAWCWCGRRRRGVPGRERQRRAAGSGRHSLARDRRATGPGTWAASRSHAAAVPGWWPRASASRTAPRRCCAAST